jgi:hypothetical protein
MPADAATLLESPLAALAACVAANHRAMRQADRVTAALLETQNRAADRFIRRLRAALARGPTQGFRDSDAGLFGPNGHGPAIDDVVRTSAFHRRFARAQAA